MTSTSRSRKRTRLAIALGSTAVFLAGTTAAQAGGWFQSAPSHDFVANADSFSGHGTLTGNVLRNDLGSSAVVRQTKAANGTAKVNADGSFSYTPNAGFHGTDTFTYTATDAVQLFKDAAANGTPLAWRA